ncbi:hypothetical protein CROQUDRAFT_665563, partial [Cronartium quercuum f. sp. fusiforme G11]
MSRNDSEDWQKAVGKELDAREEQAVFEEVELPDGAHALRATWVLRVETGANSAAFSSHSSLSEHFSDLHYSLQFTL